MIDEDQDEDHVAEHLAPFPVRFGRPEWWDFRQEHERTWLYWDEYTGSFRVTPMKIDSPAFRIDEYLAGVCADEQGTWRTIGSTRFVTWIADGTDSTRLHWFVSGAGDLVVACSFAYDRVLLDDEFSRDELEGALEEVEAILASMTIG
jgi:hypothetical protein